MLVAGISSALACDTATTGGPRLGREVELSVSHIMTFELFDYRLCTMLLFFATSST